MGGPLLGNTSRGDLLMDAYRDLSLSGNGVAGGRDTLHPVELNTVDIGTAVRSLRSYRTEVMYEKVRSFDL
jgi:hypothetical protein